MITDMKVEFGGAAAPSVIPTEVEGSRVSGAQAKSGAPAIPQARSSEGCAEHRLRLTDEARSLDSAGDHERLLPFSSEVAGPTHPFVSEQQEKRARPVLFSRMGVPDHRATAVSARHDQHVDARDHK